MAAVDQRHARARPRQVAGRHRTRRPGSDDDDIERCHYRSSVSRPNAVTGRPKHWTTGRRKAVGGCDACKDGSASHLRTLIAVAVQERLGHNDSRRHARSRIQGRQPKRTLPHRRNAGSDTAEAQLVGRHGCVVPHPRRHPRRAASTRRRTPTRSSTRSTRPPRSSTSSSSTSRKPGPGGGGGGRPKDPEPPRKAEIVAAKPPDAQADSEARRTCPTPEVTVPIQTPQAVVTLPGALTPDRRQHRHRRGRRRQGHRHRHRHRLRRRRRQRRRLRRRRLPDRQRRHVAAR